MQALLYELQICNRAFRICDAQWPLWAGLANSSLSHLVTQIGRNEAYTLALNPTLAATLAGQLGQSAAQPVFETAMKRLRTCNVKGAKRP